MTVRKGYVPRGSSAMTARSASVPKGTKRRRKWGQERLSGKRQCKKQNAKDDGMKDKERVCSYEDLPLVLNVADIQRIMGISRVSAYGLVHQPGFPAVKSGRLIKIGKRAFFDWLERGGQDCRNK